MSTLLVGCEAKRADRDPSPEERRDAQELAEVLASDPVPATLEEVDRTVDEGKPVRASELLEAGVIPAAERHHDRLRSVSAQSEPGAALQRALSEAYQERSQALDAYRRALARGELDDAVLITAMGAQRQADAKILAVDGAVREIIGASSHDSRHR